MFHRLMNLAFPAQCAACRRVGSGLCTQCAPPAPAIRRRIATLDVVALADYEGTYRHAVRALKDGRRDVAAALAMRIAEILPQGAIVVPVPTTPSRRRVRGFDGVEAVATLAIEACGGAALNVLRCIGGAPQRGKSRLERLAGRGRFRCESRLVDGVEIVLLDDVCTTGATLEDCSSVLREAGATVSKAFVVAVANGRA